jgi:tetratricopeptide (TPR) repeat protein
MCGLLLAICALAACGDPAPPRSAPAARPSHDRAVADLAAGTTTELDGAAPGFGDGVLAELMGDEQAARAAYEKVLAATDVPAAISARAAIYFAQIESRAGHTRHALDLVARATALAPTDPVIAAGAASLQADIVAAAGAGDIRGPRIGTTLPSVKADVADAWAAAERDLAAIHRGRLRIVIEALQKTIDARINQAGVVIAKYRAIAERGGLPMIAATYRAGSLFHDLALELVFADLPPELEGRSAGGLRATLRGLAITYLKKAVAEYRACIEAPQHPDGELWRLAAETDIRRATDVLRAAGVRL